MSHSSTGGCGGFTVDPAGRLTPRELATRHLEGEDPYVILDLRQTYVNGLALRNGSHG